VNFRNTVIVMTSNLGTSSDAKGEFGFVTGRTKSLGEREQLRKNGLPAQKIASSPLLADLIHELGFRKAEDFYVALGSEKIAPRQVVGKVMQRLKEGEAAEGEPTASELLSPAVERERRPAVLSSEYGIKVEGVENVMVRLAKCCKPVPGDEILGYISLGRGVTIHRDDCPNAKSLMRDPKRFTGVAWEGEGQTAFHVEIQVHGWDRHRLLEDLSRVFAETGINIVEAQCSTSEQMVRNRFIVEVADTKTLKAAIARLRNTESVFDAYRVTPGGG
jgi:GTP pyrophosphokinase